jgi:hypothetical protein
MNNRRTAVALAAVVSALLSVSCAHLPQPAREPGGLLVIPVRAAGTSYAGYPLAYDLGVAGSDRVIGVNVREGLVLRGNLPPGTHTIDRVITLAGPEIAGGVYAQDPRPEPFGPVTFTMRPGEITVFPVTLIVTVAPRGAENHVQSLTLVQTDTPAVLTRLREYRGFAAWRAAPEQAGTRPALAGPAPREVHERLRWD